MPTMTLFQSRSHRCPPEESMIQESLQLAIVEPKYIKKGILVHKFCPLRPEIQPQVETDSLLAEAYGKGTSSSRISEADRRAAINREIHESIDRAKKKPFDVNMPLSIDRYLEFGRRAFDLFGAKKFHWEDKDEYGIYRDDQGCARDMDGHIINVSKEEIIKLMERDRSVGRRDL
ncbi:hypothetical protein F2Q68_00039567 [Brassica cretica]|uniref:Uncharacterized protein n=1 Tax=Brassica cretica TaxID=69181 RepID=A0A8S9MCK8_BRACR|nr:hypothetical protein F2Q68_00039567 [Brassica cretica]